MDLLSIFTKILKQDSNTLKYILFGYYMNKLWIFEVWNTILKPWFNMIYNKCTFLDYYNVFSPLQAYFLPIHKNGKVWVLGKLPYIWIFEDGTSNI